MPITAMKRLFFILFVCLITGLKSKAQSDTTQLAKVYIIRATGYTGSLVNLRAMIDDQLFCKIKNNRFAVAWVKPGSHKFFVTSWDGPSKKEKLGLEIPIEAGKIYYLRMVMKQRFFETQMYFEEITENSAAPLLAKHKEDKECD